MLSRAILATVVIATASLAAAQPAPAGPAAEAPSPPARIKPTTLAKGEADLLVGPGGAAFEIPIAPRQICTLSFPETISSSGMVSSAEIQMKPWGNQAIGVLAESDTTPVTTLAVSTDSGSIKVNLTFRIAAPGEEPLSMVRFKAVTAEEAIEARVQQELAKRLAPLKARLEALERNNDARIRDRADSLNAERALLRNETLELDAHARTDDHVIAHVERAFLFGDDAYLFFEIENRSASAYHLSRVAVTAEGKPMHGPVRLRATSLEKDPTLVGTVAAGASARGVVVVRNVATLPRKSLTLELADRTGRRSLRVDRGIVLR